MSQDFEGPAALDRKLQLALRYGDVTPEDLLYVDLLERITASSASTSNTRRLAFDSQDQTTPGLTEGDRAEMYRQSRFLVRDDSMASNILMKYMVHVTGKNLSVRVALDEEGKQTAAGMAFDAIFAEGEAEDLVRKIVSGTLVNGNMFALHLPLQSFAVRKVSSVDTVGYPQCRVILPELVRQIKRKDSWSVTGPAHGYELTSMFKKFFPGGTLPADNVTHFRVFQEWNDGLWGISLFWQLAKEMPRYIDWLEQRALKSRVDNMTYLFRMRKNAESGKKYEFPERPMIIDINKETEDVKPVNMGQGSSGTSPDALEFRLRLAQAVHLPEPDVSEDPSRAAQLGQLGFPARMYEMIQTMLTNPIKRLFAKTVGCRPRDIILEWPRVDTRDRARVVTEVSGLEKDGTISKAQVRRVLDYNEKINTAEIQEQLTQGMTGQAGPAMPDFLSGAGSGLSAPPGGMASGGAPSLSSLIGSPTSPNSPASSSPKLSTSGAPNITGVKMTLPASLSFKRLFAAFEDQDSTLSETGGEEDQFSAGDLYIAEQIIQMKGMSKFGPTYEDIVKEIPKLTKSVMGYDYGYAAQGAGVLAGMSESGDIYIAAEITYKRVPTEKWVEVHEYVKSIHPELEKAVTGSDQPGLTDAFVRAGILAAGKHYGEEHTMPMIKQFLASGKRIYVHEQCSQVLASLFEPEVESIAGAHVGEIRHDHRDAWRYAIIGLMELTAFIEPISDTPSPEKGLNDGGITNEEE